MHVGIDALGLRQPYGGVQRSIWGLIEGFSALDEAGALAEDDRFTIVTGRGAPMPELGARFKILRTWFRSEWRSVRIFYQQFFLHRRLFKAGAEILHGPAYTLPRLGYLPMVVTLHDTIALEAPVLVSRANAAHFGRFVPHAVRLAARIVVPSSYVADRVRALYPESAGRIRVVPFGVESMFLQKTVPPLPEGAPMPRSRFILFVGVLETKKNPEGLIKAFFAAVMATKRKVDLLFVGSDGGIRRRLERLAASLKFTDRVHFAGYVSREWLPAIYRRAEAVVLPSVAEGFGFPVLEAMASKSLLVASELRPLRELAGDAAVYVRPGDIPSLREALEMVLAGGPRDREKRLALGFKRANEYTWERTARETMAVYREAYAERHSD